jgi:ribosomal protein L40E
MAKRTVGYVQLEWVCPNCNSRNPGPVKTCANCGAPQPENVQFERTVDEKLVTEEKAVQAAQAGADIHCGFCGTRNPATATTCSQCGGDLKEGMKRQSGQVMQARPEGPRTVNCTNCGTENPVSNTMCAKCGSPLPRGAAPASAASVLSKPAAAAAKKKPNWLLFGGIGTALLLCCAAVLFLFVFPSRSLQGTVTDVHWQTSVPVQEIQAVDHSNERGSPPSDAYNVSCHTESRDVCEQKTIDKGNGYAEVVEECHTETEQNCDYTVDEWRTIQTYTLDGNDLFPVYADPSLTTDQRQGSPSEDLKVIFSTEDGQKTYSPGTVSEFQQFETGSQWMIKMNALGGVVNVER